MLNGCIFSLTGTVGLKATKLLKNCKRKGGIFFLRITLHQTAAFSLVKDDIRFSS